MPLVTKVEDIQRYDPKPSGKYHDRSPFESNFAGCQEIE
jgi:hypothetical protein